MNRYIQQLDLSIIQDWTSIQLVHAEVSRKVKTGSEDITDSLVENGFCTRYKLGEDYEADWGKWPYQAAEHELTCDTINLRGKKFREMLPWLNQLITDTKDIRPIIDHIGYYDLMGSYFDHVDCPELPTSLIWFHEDYEAETIVHDDEVTEIFPSQKNTAWLFDTQVMHRVENHSPTRYAFIVRYDAPFSECREWFLSHPNLSYGST